jgi:hypothetical protein
MNCFNIRELQGILKRKFFTDLVNSSEHKYLLDSSVIGLRFKNNLEDFIRPDQSLFYNYGLTTNPKSKSYMLQNLNVLPSQGKNFSSYDNYIMSYLTKATVSGSNNLIPTLNSTILQPLNEILIPLKLNYILRNAFTSVSYFNIEYVYNLLAKMFSNILNTPRNLVILNNNFAENFDSFSLNSIFNNSSKNADTSLRTYNTENIINYSSENLMFFNFIETSNSFRLNRFNNPLINYDYKCGHYLMIWPQLYPALSASFIEVARGIRKAPWFYSDQFIDLLKSNYSNYVSKFTNKLNLKLSDVDNWYSTHVNPSDSYLNVFYMLNKHEGFVNLRWISINALDQKFTKMFNSQSTQQRILAN